MGDRISSVRTHICATKFPRKATTQSPVNKSGGADGRHGLKTENRKQNERKEDTVKNGL